MTVSFSLRDQVALVTGASKGIGQAIAKALHARGASLVVTARRTEVLDELRSVLGDGVDPVAADLSDRDEVARLAERCAALLNSVAQEVHAMGSNVEEMKELLHKLIEYTPFNVYSAFANPFSAEPSRKCATSSSSRHVHPS